MRILQVHNRYQHAGGEDTVVKAERALLAENGQEVFEYSVSNESISGAWQAFKAAWQAPYSADARKKLTREIGSFRPDIVHVHNFFPLLTPSIYDACHDAGVPVVQTLHNYRPVCPGALLLRDGKACEACISGNAYHSVIHRCYRKSFWGTLAVARMVHYHHRVATWQQKVNRFVALTEFAKSIFVSAAFPHDKISVKPNFVKNTLEPREVLQTPRDNCALFVGRLSEEKGVRLLLAAWKHLDVQLRIVGDGPMEEFVRKNLTDKIVFLGRLSPNKVMDEMANASFLVMPSLWYETFGMVVVEGYSCGLPVIASRLGCMVEVVENGVTGLHFAPGDPEDLVAKVRWAYEHQEAMQQMGKNARCCYENKYAQEANYRQIMTIYQEVLREQG